MGYCSAVTRDGWRWIDPSANAQFALTAKDHLLTESRRFTRFPCPKLSELPSRARDSCETTPGGNSEFD